MKTCPNCSKTIERNKNKYCSNKCESAHRYHEYIDQWKKGFVDGSRGINTKNISGHIRRYLLERYGEKCIICGWDTRHAITGRVPLEVDHIDGNSENNSEKNLRLICPNCHSLSLNFKNLNKGYGRVWRKEKYIKVIR